jgi:hypothetical protein
MSALPEALSILLNWIRIVWDLLEPILGAPYVVALLLVVYGLWWILRRRRRHPLPARPSRVASRLGSDPSLLAVCELLGDLTREYAQPLNLSNDLSPEAAAIVDDLRDESIRLYVFGLQNAGKSTFVNALLGHALAPESPGKKTTVVVRIRRGVNSRLTLLWPDGAREENLSPRSLSKRMEHWSEEPRRPREAIIESPLINLGIPHLEVVDTPGTGSAWTVDPTKSIEDEIVDHATRMAAVAAVIYRHNLAELEDHERILKTLGASHIPTLGICNLEAGWAQAYQKKTNEVERVMALAEARLRTLAKAKCYRVDLQENAAIEPLAKSAGACTVSQMRSAVVKFVGEQRDLGVRQALRRCNALISDLQARADFWIQRAGPVVDSIEKQRAPLANAMTSVLSLLVNPATHGRAATVIGGVGGGATTIAILGTSAAFPPAAPVVLGLAALWAGIGAAVGWFIDGAGVREWRQQLAQALGQLGSACSAATLLVPAAFANRFASLAESIDSIATRKAINELEEEVKRALERNHEYAVFAAAKELSSDLSDTRTALKRFVSL